MCVFVSRFVYLTFFSNLSITTNDVFSKIVKRFSLFDNLLICHTFDENTSFENLIIVITLSSLEYKSSDIFFVYQKFENDASLESSIVVIKLFSLFENNDESIVCNN